MAPSTGLVLVFLLTAVAVQESKGSDQHVEDAEHYLGLNTNIFARAVAAKAFTCPSAGTFPDPDPLKCQTYYRCTTKLVAYTYTCPGNTAFNKATLQCTATIPATCKPTTTTSTTTTTTTSTTSTTTTPAPTSTSTTSTASTPPSQPPFTCTAPGIFAEPTNCKTYYRCTTTLIAYTYNCPGNSLFDPDLLVCTMNTPAKCVPTTPVAMTTTTPALTTTPVPITSTPAQTTTTVPTTTDVTTDPAPTDTPP